LVDHGCDGFAMGYFALILLKLVQSGDTVLALAATNCSTFGFYVSTLEHYYTQNHFMGPGNMVTDGSIIIILIFFGMAFTGNDFFGDKLSKDSQYTWGYLMSFILGTVGSLNVVAYGYECLTHKPSEFTSKQFKCPEFVVQLLGYIVMVLVTSSLLFMGESPLIDRQNLYQFEGPTPLFSVIMVQNFLFAHMNFSIIINHVSAQIFNPFKNKLLLFTILYIAGVYIAVKTSPGINIMNAIYTLFFINLFCIIHFLVSVSRQLKAVLCIPFFFTYDPEERDKKLEARKKLNKVAAKSDE